MKRYFKIWWRMTANSFQTIIASRFGMAVFLLGKFLRFAIYLAFIYFLFAGVKQVVGFDRSQVLLFLLTFVFLGSFGQMVLREAYRFRGKLASGEFDFDLLKPIHPLFKNLAGGFDLLDLMTMPVFLYFLVKTIEQINFSWLALLLYLLLLVNGFIIMLAIHIIVMAFGVMTLEVDNTIMIYRDLETMGRFPVDIYKEPLRQILTFVVPIGIMFTVPVKALLGLLSWPTIFFSVVVGGVSFYLAARFWSFSLKRYSSASS